MLLCRISAKHEEKKCLLETWGLQQKKTFFWNMKILKFLEFFFCKMCICWHFEAESVVVTFNMLVKNEYSWVGQNLSFEFCQKHFFVYILRVKTFELIFGRFYCKFCGFKSNSLWFNENRNNLIIKKKIFK